MTQDQFPLPGDGQSNNQAPAYNKTAEDQPKSDADILKVNARIDDIANKFDRMIDVTQSLANRQVAAPVVQVTPSSTEPQESFADKLDADPESAIEALADKRIEEKLNAHNLTIETKQLQDKYDNKAYDMFPDLHDKSSQMYKKTSEVIASMKTTDPKAEQRPDLVWVAANVAMNKMSASPVPANDSRRNEVIRESSLEGGRQSNVQRGGADGQVSDNQKKFASLWGCPVDVYKK